jgi:uncharacterized protein (TIGR00106 family)
VFTAASDQRDASLMLLAFSVTPLGVSESVGDVVADAVRIVRESGLPNETNAMFTNIEGEWDEVMAVLRDCVEAVTQRAPRVSVVAKIDYRPGHEHQLDEKVASVERRLHAG